MVDNLAENVNKCSLNRGCYVLFTYNWDRKNRPLYGVAQCPLFRGCLSIEVNGRINSRNCPLYNECPLLGGVH